MMLTLGRGWAGWWEGRGRGGESPALGSGVCGCLSRATLCPPVCVSGGVLGSLGWGRWGSWPGGPTGPEAGEGRVLRGEGSWSARFLGPSLWFLAASP